MQHLSGKLVLFDQILVERYRKRKDNQKGKQRHNFPEGELIEHWQTFRTGAGLGCGGIRS